MLTATLINQADEVIADLDWTQVRVRRELMAEGGWEVVAAGDPEVFRLIRSRTEPYLVLLTDHSTGEVHGGPIRRTAWNGPESDGVMTLSGPDANWYANTYPVLPIHTQSSYPGASSPRSRRGYTLTQRHGSEAIHRLVDDQAKNTGLSYRNLDLSLTLASLVSTGFELTSYEAEPFENVLDTIRRWGYESGVIADFRWRGVSTTAELVTRLPAVRDFRLWEQDGFVIDWEWFEEADTVNYLWTGGQGDGVNREVSPVGPPNGVPAKWGIVIERFFDAGSTESAALGDAARVKIVESEPVEAITASGVAVEGVEFGADYQLGDIVSAVFLSTEYLRVVTAVELEWSAAGKQETLETGEPPLAIYQQPGVTLGEQPAVAYRPTAGLRIGELQLVNVFDPDAVSMSLDIEIVYAKAAGPPADQPRLTLEYRADGGSWTLTSAGPNDLALGPNELYYFTRNSGQFTTPSFVSTLEFRATLTQTGEATVYSPVLLVASSGAAPPSGSELAWNDAGDPLTWNDAGDPLTWED